MMKRLGALGTSIWSGVSVLLACAAFILFWGFVAYWIYAAVQRLGFSDQAAYWCTIVFIGIGGVFFYALSRDTLKKWAVTLMAWALIVAIILAIGFAALAVILTPPSLYSLVVIGLFLLAGILWQLAKIANK